ncbi:MAG TPA: type II secretion system protein GspC [Myxococcota bacterium]|nr:type II secretion system protein GspC [Myxococcota bacterium]
MQEFIRRHFWVATLGVIAVGAFLAAGLFSEALGFVLMGGASGSEQSGEGGDLPTPVPVVVRPSFGTSILSVTSERNIFNAEPEVTVEEGEPGEGDGTGQGGGAAISLNVRLLGTMMSTKAADSLAMITLDEKPRLVRTGQMLNEIVEVFEIHARYIVLRQGENLSVVTLWDEAVDRAAPRGATQAAAAVGTAPAESGDAYAAGIQKKGPYDYQIDRNMLEEQLQDLTKLGMQARIVPNYEGGKYAGFRLVGIRPNSLYKALGMQSGDLLQRINGEEIDTPNKAIQLFESLRSSSQIAIDVVRRGKKVTMNYTIQ